MSSLTDTRIIPSVAAAVGGAATAMTRARVPALIPTLFSGGKALLLSCP